MKLFIDTANLDEIREAALLGHPRRLHNQPLLDGPRGSKLR